MSTELLIFSIALVIRLLVLLLSFQYHDTNAFLTMTTDVVNYVGAADALCNGEIFSIRNDLFYFPVGYPLFLALLFTIFGQSAVTIILYSCFALLQRALQCMYLHTT